MSLDLLNGLLAPYQGGGSSMSSGPSPLMALALQAALQPATSSFDSGSVGGGGGGGGVSSPAPMGGGLQSWIDQAEQITGTSGVPDVDRMLHILISHESGGSPTIVNDTPTPKGYHATGLAQMIQPTFDAYNIPGLGPITNPVANLAAAIRYMQDRYGSIAQTPGIASVLAGHGYQPY